MRRYSDRLHSVASRGTSPCPLPAGCRSAGRLRRLCLVANCAFGQRFLGHSPSGPGSARPRPGGSPLAPRPPAERGGHGPFTPLRCPGCCEGSPAVTNPKGNLIFTRFPAAARGSVLGLVTAHSRAPRQRSRPTREASLGLGLPSALPGGRSVGLSVARHLVWGRWCRARSRRLEGAT